MFSQLKPRQVDAVKFALKIKTAAIFAEAGTGKTWITGGVIEKVLEQAFLPFKFLAVVPLSNLDSTWIRLLDKIHGLEICLTWADFKHSKTDCIFLIHYEALQSIQKKVAKINWTLAVFDESQRIKSRSSKASKAAAKIQAEYKLLLSGTPFDDLLDDPQELWSQFRFLVPELFGTRWKDFDDEYLRKTGYMGYKRKFRKEKLPEFLKKIEPYVLRITKDEVYDLERPKYIKVPILMVGEQDRIYRALEDEMVAEFNGSSVTTGLKITQLAKLQQICGGFIIDDDRVTHSIGKAKLMRTRHLLKRIPKPVVVVCKYLREIDEVAEEASGAFRNVSIITGKTRKTRTQVRDRFQAGEIDVLVLQVRTGGVGIDLFASHNMILYSSTWSWVDFDQVISRLDRSGQEKRVNVYILCCQNTIDDDIYKGIISKRSVTELILNRFRRPR